MDPKTIAQLIASGDKEQIKEAQRQLQALGYYQGAIDGSLGKNPSQSQTMQAMQSYAQAESDRQAQAAEEAQRNARIRETQAVAEAERGKAEAAKSTAEAGEIEQKTKAREEYQRQATSPLGMGTQFAASVAAPAATTALGYRVGGSINNRMNEAQALRNQTLRGAAEDRVRGLTTREGAVTGTRLAGAMPPRNALLRAGTPLGIPTLIVEQTFAYMLREYIRFMDEVLAVPPPYRVEGGASNVKGHVIFMPSQYFHQHWGPIQQNHVSWSGTLATLDAMAIDEVLLAIFEAFFDAGAETRPNHLYGFPGEEPGAMPR